MKQTVLSLFSVCCTCWFPSETSVTVAVHVFATGVGRSAMLRLTAARHRRRTAIDVGIWVTLRRSAPRTEPRSAPTRPPPSCHHPPSFISSFFLFIHFLWSSSSHWPRGLSVSLTSASQSRRRKEKGRTHTHKKNSAFLKDKNEFVFLVW